jgi:hypothetical protein
MAAKKKEEKKRLHLSPQHERSKSFATFPTPHIWFKNFDKTGLCKAKEPSREWQHQKEC